jgi:alkyldihydroxyacetonephosphate synthase
MSLWLDEKSLLARIDGSMTLAEVEGALAPSGMTLDVPGAETSPETVAAWLAGGARGARDAWLDPADHLVAGLDLRLHDGRRIVVRPAPRRAVGPDLIALVVGMGERFGKVEQAWVRVHPVGVKRPSVGPVAVELDPAVSEEEARLLDAMTAQLAGWLQPGGQAMGRPPRT